MLAGMAKPMPMLPPEGDRICELMPISSPCVLTSAPPELPWLIGRVGLDEVLVAAVAAAVTGRPPLRADDAHRDGLADAERVADRERDVADAHLVGVRRAAACAGWRRRSSSTARSLGASVPTTLAANVRPSVISTLT